MIKVTSHCSLKLLLSCLCKFLYTLNKSWVSQHSLETQIVINRFLYKCVCVCVNMCDFLFRNKRPCVGKCWTDVCLAINNPWEAGRAGDTGVPTGLCVCVCLYSVAAFVSLYKHVLSSFSSE